MKAVRVDLALRPCGQFDGSENARTLCLKVGVENLVLCRIRALDVCEVDAVSVGMTSTRNEHDARGVSGTSRSKDLRRNQVSK